MKRSILVGDVRPASQHPLPCYDQNLRYTLPPLLRHPGETWGMRQLKGKKEEKAPP